MAGTTDLVSTDGSRFALETNGANSTATEFITHGYSMATTPDDNDEDYYDGEFTFNDYTQRCIVGTIFVIVSIVGTFGNGLVILAVILSRKLRTVTNVFVVNLAVADLLVCLILPWNAVGLFTSPELGWPLPEKLCVAVALISYTCGGCSLYTLATIAINRWMLITRPSRTYRTCYKPAYLAVMVTVVWLIPLLVAWVPPMLGLGELGYTEKYSTCTHKNSHELAPYYSLLQSIIFLPVPFIIIIVSYVNIFRHVRQHTKVLMTNQEKSVELSETSNYRENNTSGARELEPSSPVGRSQNLSVAKKRLSRRQVEITKNLFYVVCAFTVCILPYGIALLIPPSDPIIPWTAALFLVNSCINPIIYATKHPYFKQVFKLMLTCHCGKIPEQSDFLRSVRSTVRRSRGRSKRHN
ncbi:probable G-protein coupled receptor No18 [Patiria miniata]|uniref:G-protein coupled receptors family 1 profile domain-containing protein n=1 Tax=Patiria miniata TaxID=46514 RepID=A0A913YZ67_PATMI|nr:probable G-protein coupled receptor No18 [Patiria miniata]